MPGHAFYSGHRAWSTVCSIPAKYSTATYLANYPLPTFDSLTKTLHLLESHRSNINIIQICINISPKLFQKLSVGHLHSCCFLHSHGVCFKTALCINDIERVVRVIHKWFSMCKGLNYFMVIHNDSFFQSHFTEIWLTCKNLFIFNAYNLKNLGTQWFFKLGFLLCLWSSYFSCK